MDVSAGDLEVLVGVRREGGLGVYVYEREGSAGLGCLKYSSAFFGSSA